MTTEGVAPDVCAAVAAVIPWIAAFTTAMTMAAMSTVPMSLLTGIVVVFPPGTSLPGTPPPTSPPPLSRLPVDNTAPISRWSAGSAPLFAAICDGIKLYD